MYFHDFALNLSNDHSIIQHVVHVKYIDCREFKQVSYLCCLKS
uniref:Uncharacterized protein LOC105640153 isoform X3 n=1 Tax=Rhizophora mucronata TaxID=61149 RepID=A0A2P2PU36_RHIMU